MTKNNGLFPLTSRRKLQQPTPRAVWVHSLPRFVVMETTGARSNEEDSIDIDNHLQHNTGPGDKRIQLTLFSS